jgi:hypothetical protein
MHGSNAANAVTARLDRATQYSEGPVLNISLAEYWITRFRG